MDKLQLFYWALNHPWIGKKLMNRLSFEDKEIILKFLDENLSLDPSQFELKINRLWMDQKDKPKRWKEILEILSNMNSKRNEGNQKDRRR